MKHDYYDREDGLLHCKVCGGAEGSLPTDCPGRRMTDAEEEQVYAGTLNYREGQWVPVRCKDCDLPNGCPEFCWCDSQGAGKAEYASWFPIRPVSATAPRDHPT